MTNKELAERGFTDAEKIPLRYDSGKIKVHIDEGKGKDRTVKLIARNGERLVVPDSVEGLIVGLVDMYCNLQDTVKNVGQERDFLIYSIESLEDNPVLNLHNFSIKTMREFKEYSQGLSKKKERTND